MPKRKKPTSDQTELPLEGASSEVQPNPASATNGAASDPPAHPEVAALAPTRKPGQKVQDEQAPLAVSYRNWFLDYASYVILDRAVPHIDDGLKPVQRRGVPTARGKDDRGLPQKVK